VKRFTKKVAVFLLSFLVVLSGMVTPSPVSAEAATEQSESQTFIEKGASWKYLDDGSDQGTAWKEENFDDSIWKSGAAPLGFKYDVKTTVSYGPDKDNKYITTYFRSNFEVKDTALVKTLKASVFLDDAAVFYINGKEIHRENMPEGNVDYKALSKDSLGTVKNDIEFDVDPTVLKQGTNTIAVEVHQRSADSSDLVFDMNLISNKKDEPSPSQPEPTNDAIKDITFAPGKDASQVNFTWYSKSDSEPQVQIAPKSDAAGSDFPTDKSQTFKGEKSEGSYGYYSDKVTVTGLKQATEYVYRVGDGTSWSSTNNYTTQDISKGFNFLFAGDPQIGAGGDIKKDGDGWVDTLNKAADKFKNTSFIMSVGDQVNNGGELNGQTNELEYDEYFRPQQLRNLPVAAIAGNHENGGVGHITHFNTPNMSDKYGLANEGTGSDYYYVYGNTLFMMLNSNDKNLEDHKTFMEEAIDANPNVTWKIVSMHHAVYSSANHETDDDIIARRNTYPQAFEQLGIDVVLDGHDHSYTRTYQMLGGKAVSAAGDTKVTNPKGVLYVTANSASGSKYYELQEPNENNYYEAKKEQIHVPTFSDVSITDDSFTINTYRTDTMEATDSYTISKPSSSGGSSGGSGGSSSGSSVNVKNSNADSVVNSIKKAKSNASINIDVSDNKKVSKDIFEAAKGTDKKLVFKADNIEWTFNGNDISTSKDVDMTADIAAIKDSASPNKQSIEDKVQDTDVYVASFFNNGELPGKSTVKIKLDGNWLKDKDKNTLNVYYYNESSKALNSIESGLKADSDNCIEFDISHTSDYIISDKKLISQEQVRLGGSDRYETSAKISQNKWTNADAAVLVSGEAFADALSSVPFAKQLNAPVLLTSSNSLNKNTASELSRLKVKKVYIIGGTGVISDLVENSIKDMNISTERIAGADRYSTSLAVAKKLGTPAQIFLCSGANFPDGLSVSSYAALSSSPVILTNGNEMESNTAKFIGDSNARVYVIGGNGVVKDSLLQGISNAERISGTDRYSTNLAVLAKFSDKFDLSNVYLASGKDFADALCGSAAAGQEKAPIILLDSILSDNVKNYIKDKKSNVNEVNILGGEGVIPQSIVDQLLQ
jgi:putative cell wall-binding protein